MNVVIYARYSSDRQTEQSIEGQLKECYEYARRNGYAVVGESVDPRIARVRYVNLNDGTVEGLEHIGRPVFTVQYHPEVCPGPMDTSYLFDKFIENIEKSKGGAQ